MTTYKNSYTPPVVDIPADIHATTAPEVYDFNYVFEVKSLRSDRVELRPFVPSIHAQSLWDGIQANPEILKWLGGAPWTSINDVYQWTETICRRPSTSLHYAVYTAPLNKLDADVSEYVFAGCVGMIESSYEQMISEPGWLLIMTPFQRTHVLTHAAGLMMHRILDKPEEGGLGLRRCQWQTTTLNLPSQKAALRLGYKHEGVLRAVKVLPKGKIGIRDGRPGVRLAENPQRDSWVASVMWYEWEESVKAHIDALMARRS